MTTLNIYFKDLNEDAKRRMLEFYGIDDKSQGNFRIPLAILEKDETTSVTFETSIEG